MNDLWLANEVTQSKDCTDEELIAAIDKWATAIQKVISND